jgi:hypothetical protein
MTDTLVTCPHCGNQFPLSEALTAQLHAGLEAEHEARLKAAVAEARTHAERAVSAQIETLNQLLEGASQKAREAEAREFESLKNAQELKRAQAQVVERARLEVEERLRHESEATLKARVAEAEHRAKTDAVLERERLEARLAEEQGKRQIAEKAELTLRQQAEALEARAQELDLEVARQLGAKKAEWEQVVRHTLGQEQDLKLKEKEKQIDDMKQVIDDLKRKSEQGSQEMQGEVLEIDIQEALERQFPQDAIRPVPKGMSGADLIHEVRDGAFNPCGALVWEVKNTKHWQAAWLDKLKADQRAAGAALAVLVSVALPDGVRGFARMDGVWVCDLTHYPALAVALRDQLQQVAFARAASQGKNEKMEMLYAYLAGDEFRHRVETIVEAFTAMRGQLDRERRAMMKHWAEREKQIERVIGSTTGMYGALAGIIGSQLPEIPALALDDVELLKDNDA